MPLLTMPPTQRRRRPQLAKSAAIRGAVAAGFAGLLSVAITSATLLGAAPTQARAVVPTAFGPAGGHETASFLVEIDAPALADIVFGRYSVGRERGPASDITDAVLPPRDTLAALEAAIIRSQSPSRRAIESLDRVEVVAAFQVVASALLIHAPPDLATDLARLPGVSRVWRVPLHTPQLAESSPHIGAPWVREHLDLDGEGVIVAVVDAGIDYTHAAFGGPGTRLAFEANDENQIEPGSFPTEKVVAGYDFAGERYSPNCARLPGSFPNCDEVPHPDDDPLEPIELAHGTAVAGIIGGEGSRDVDPGVAPGASLVALKIYGNPIGAPPATDLTLGALEWIAAHNMGLEVPGTKAPGPIGVVNLSVGVPWATGFPPIEKAVADVVATGAAVIASAGDSGPIPFVAGQPGAASEALAVGATVPPGRGEKDKGIEAEWAGEHGVRHLTAAMLEANFTPPLQVTGPITEPLSWYGLACDTESGQPPAPVQDVADRIALIERGDCTFFEKLSNAYELGAVAALVFTDKQEKTTMTCEPPDDCANPPLLPAVMVDREPGVLLSDLLTSGKQVTVTLNADREVPIENLTDTMALFSSRGPTRQGLSKPELVAPGAGIFSAFSGGGQWGVARSGTSIAAPFVSGVAALLGQRDAAAQLGLGPLDIYALLVNTADPVLRLDDGLTGDQARVARQGAGLVDAYEAASATVLVREATGRPTLDFGHLHLLDEQLAVSRTLILQSLTAETQTYVLGWESAAPSSSSDRAAIAFDLETVYLPGGGDSAATVRLTIEPEQLPDWNLRGFNQALDERVVAGAEIDGYVKATRAGSSSGGPGDSARVPFYVLPRRHSCVAPRSRGPLFYAQPGELPGLQWDNECGARGTVEVFSLVGLDAAESLDGYPANIDIEAVGVRYGPSGPDSEPLLIEWAIKTSGDRGLPAEAEFRVYVDLDLDGTFDRVVLNRLGREIINFPEIANRWVVAHAPLASGTLEPDLDLVSTDIISQRYDLDESVSMIQVGAESLGVDLSQGEATFGFAVYAFEAAGDYPITDSYPGYDWAPDGAEDGQMYTFSQRQTFCLTLKGDVGRSLTYPQEGLTIAPSHRRAAELELVCDPLLEATPSDGVAGLLISYPENMPGESQSEIRRLRRLGPGTPIYLPYATQH